jgi:hypothetical protein
LPKAVTLLIRAQKKAMPTPVTLSPQLFSSAGAFAMGDMLLPRRRNPHTLSKSLAFGILLFLDQSGTNLVNFLTHCNRIWKPDFRFDL